MARGYFLARGDCRLGEDADVDLVAESVWRAFAAKRSITKLGDLDGCYVDDDGTMFILYDGTHHTLR